MTVSKITGACLTLMIALSYVNQVQSKLDMYKTLNNEIAEGEFESNGAIHHLDKSTPENVIEYSKQALDYYI